MNDVLWLTVGMLLGSLAIRAYRYIAVRRRIAAVHARYVVMRADGPTPEANARRFDEAQREYREQSAQPVDPTTIEYWPPTTQQALWRGQQSKPLSLERK